MNERDKVVTKYNTGITWLLDLLLKFDPRDVDTDRLKKRITLAKTGDHEILLKEAGPYLLKYRTYIDQRKAEFFLANDPEETAQMDEMARNLFAKIREYYKRMNTKERSVLYGKVDDLLTAYIEYLAILIAEEQAKNAAKLAKNPPAPVAKSATTKSK